MHACFTLLLMWSAVVSFSDPDLPIPPAGMYDTIPLPLQTATPSDTIHSLQEVVIRAYEAQKPWMQEAAPVAVLNTAQITRYSQASILPAMNTVAGIRMEQRSPSSYRLNIRGSSIRAPFGVREVNIYYNDIPLTSPGGDTYLNQLDVADFGQIQVIKGPAASVYGSGIGGVMLIQSPLAANATGNPAVEQKGLQHIQLQYEAGSYQTHHIIAQGSWGSATHLQYAHYNFFRSEGYRHHTASWQHSASYESLWKPNTHRQADVWIHYNHLYYQTPGGLTLNEMLQNPRMARPASGPYPSADSAHAAIDQQNFIAGFSLSNQLSTDLQNRSAVYFSYTDLSNPTFRNVEYRKEPHMGVRTVMQYVHNLSNSKLTATAGTEWQQGFFSIVDYGNSNGKPDTLQTRYRETLLRGIVFAQADVDFPTGWSVTAGISLQRNAMSFYQYDPKPYTVWNLDFQNNWSPRLAILKTLFHEQMAVYVNISRGFSPPTLSELLPSTNILNTTLKPESGYNYELGWKGYALRQRLRWEINAYLFDLEQSISQQRDSSGADYFINAGHTRQPGLETSITYQLVNHTSGILPQTTVMSNLALTRYTYQGYAPLGHDYSGHRIPGVSPFTWVNELQCRWNASFSASLLWNHTQAIPLNDANTAYSRTYNLVDMSLHYMHTVFHRQPIELYAGINNLLNQLYSLGDDVNAAGGRYYNPAPARNYYAGIRWMWK
ncbi:MAG: TonB-dependent receptor plug domain-containing protein [Thermoflavifilum aggregans]|nr:TonB-dependent receptor plug domain-containing protein [Thermoflavifilum aggregans]